MLMTLGSYVSRRLNISRAAAWFTVWINRSSVRHLTNTWTSPANVDDFRFISIVKAQHL